MDNIKTLRYLVFKAKNRRVLCYLIENENGERNVAVVTKRLLDFKTRDVKISKERYSMETFLLLAEGFRMLMKDDEFVDLLNVRQMTDKERAVRVSTNLKSLLNGDYNREGL